MSHEPWYGFIDGPRDANGERVGFSSAPVATLWILITFLITGGLIAAIAVGVILLRTEVAALGFLVPLVAGAGPIAAASFIACLHTAGDLVEIIEKQRH